MSEHTPGPWEWRQSGKHGGADVYSGARNGGYICTVSGNVRPDARLITAAPDGYALAQRVLAERVFAMPDEILDAARALIAKAEGK